MIRLSNPTGRLPTSSCREVRRVVPALHEDPHFSPGHSLHQYDHQQGEIICLSQSRQDFAIAEFSTQFRLEHGSTELCRIAQFGAETSWKSHLAMVWGKFSIF